MRKNEKINGAGIIVMSRDLRKVLTLWNGEKMDLPKGTIEKGETFLNAALREGYEEAGIISSECELISDDPYVYRNIAFFYVFWDGQPQINPNPKSGIIEHDRFAWVPWRKAIDSSPDFLKPALFHGLALKSIMPWSKK